MQTPPLMLESVARSYRQGDGVLEVLRDVRLSRRATGERATLSPEDALARLAA